jgi:hypothetical protein
MATAPTGHNAPADPFEAFSLHVDDLFLEASNFLDGEPIATDGQAEAVSILLNRLRKAGNDADEARKVEKKPHDEAAKAVQTKWKPLIDRVDLAVSTAKNALAPFLKAKEDAQRAAAQAAFEEARQKALAAAHTQAAPDDLAGQAVAKIRGEEAAAALKAAQRLDKAKPQARGGERAIGLRSVFTPALTDACAALKHYRANQPDELKAWLLNQAEKDVRNGARSIPGFTITEERKAV